MPPGGALVEIAYRERVGTGRAYRNRCLSCRRPAGHYRELQFNARDVRMQGALVAVADGVGSVRARVRVHLLHEGAERSVVDGGSRHARSQFDCSLR